VPPAAQRPLVRPTNPRGGTPEQQRSRVTPFRVPSHAEMQIGVVAFRFRASAVLLHLQWRCGITHISRRKRSIETPIRAGESALAPALTAVGCRAPVLPCLQIA